MSDKVSEKPRGFRYCFEAYERFLLGGRLHVTPGHIEGDRRKQKKAMRALVDAGYVSESGGCYEATSKAWDETEAVMPDLFEAWQDSRSSWNLHSGRPAPFVRYISLMTDARKAVLTSADVRWYLVHTNVTQYRRAYDEREEFVYGPMTLTDAVNKQKELSQASYRGREYDLCIDTAELAEKIRAKLAEEKFDTLYRRNLPWGLYKLGVIQKPEAEWLAGSESAEWPHAAGSHTHLGVVPEKWGDVLAANLLRCHESIRRAQDEVVLLEAIGRGVQAMGGWDVFRSRMADELKARLAQPGGDKGDE